MPKKKRLKRSKRPKIKKGRRGGRRRMPDMRRESVLSRPGMVQYLPPPTSFSKPKTDSLADANTIRAAGEASAKALQKRFEEAGEKDRARVQAQVQELAQGNRDAASVAEAAAERSDRRLSEVIRLLGGTDKNVGDSTLDEIAQNATPGLQGAVKRRQAGASPAESPIQQLVQSPIGQGRPGRNPNARQRNPPDYFIP